VFYYRSIFSNGNNTNNQNEYKINNVPLKLFPWEETHKPFEEKRTMQGKGELTFKYRGSSLVSESPPPTLSKETENPNLPKF
jgi:hypothetical protein